MSISRYTTHDLKDLQVRLESYRTYLVHEYEEEFLDGEKTRTSLNLYKRQRSVAQVHLLECKSCEDAFDSIIKALEAVLQESRRLVNISLDKLQDADDMLALIALEKYVRCAKTACQIAFPWRVSTEQESDDE
ncbi:hypothetical protein MMC18_001018 [Xylographa bjoerkii]|nr:hypothetical protein [Xylographa bjoerkii]